MSTCEMLDLGLPGVVADGRQVTATVLLNEPMATNTWRMRLGSAELAERMRPGQFFMARPVELSDPLLGRPFALFDTQLDESGRPVSIDFGYVVVGKLTRWLSQCAIGTPVSVWGPLGNGFGPPAGNHLAIVAGGIGQTPFLPVIRQLLGLQTYGTDPSPAWPKPARISFCYGARSESYLAGVADFELPGVDVRLATDDGTRGHRGYVTEVLDELLASTDPPTSVYCCGPEGMMRATAQRCRAAGVPCWVSLETPMACGFGACFSCVTPVRQPEGDWDYRRVCVEGPVFRAEDLVWDSHP